MNFETMADVEAQPSHFPLLLVDQVIGSSLPSLPILATVHPEVRSSPPPIYLVLLTRFLVSR